MDEIIHVKNEYRQQRWAELIRQRQESGMTVVGFCEANGLKTKTYCPKQQMALKTIEQFKT